jgi:hypothetical protein
MITRLADCNPIAVGDLVRSDDERIGSTRGNRARFGVGESTSCCGWRLARQFDLIDVWCNDIEWQQQSREQLPPVPRRRREYQGSALIIRCFS